MGSTAGCNYQFGTLGVVGIEGDWSWTGIRTSVRETFPAITALSARTETFGSDMNWLATVRGRIGLLATPSVMLYLTGGAAFAQDRSTFLLVTAANSQFVGSESKTLAGGVVGAGAEWLFRN